MTHIQIVKFPNFGFLDPSTPRDRNKIFEECLSGGLGNELPAQRILDLFLPGGRDGSSINCETVIIEHEYVDSDYLASYTRHYLHAYRNYNKRCKRVHFFSSRIEEQDLLDLSSEQRDSYLGFVVIRPTGVYKIGRTLFSPVLENRNQYFILCRCRYPVNLAGNELWAEGAIFMQQDTQVAACATATIWMVQATMSQRFGLPRYSTAQITEMATRSDVSVGRAVPSSGLTVSQMLEAVRSMGYDPIVYGPQDWYEQRGTIYRYVESEIPTMVCIAYPGRDATMRRHTVSIIGHSYASSRSPQQQRVLELDSQTGTWSTALSYYPSIEWVPSFLANDDARGPYRDVEIVDPEASEVPEAVRQLIAGPHLIAIAKIDRASYANPDGPLYALIIATIVALPKGVSLTAEKAEIKARRLTFLAHRLFRLPYPPDIVLRTYLRLSNEFKSRLDSSLDASDELKAHYRNISMPKYVWVTEISTKEYMSKDKPEERLTVGEILIDSSASPWTEDFVTIHLQNLFVHMDPNDDDPSQAIRNNSRYIADDRPIPHLARPLSSICSS